MNIEELKNIIRKGWKLSNCIKINGFSFCTEECFVLFTLDNLLILNEENYAEVATIKVKDINSLIIDEKELL